MSCASPLTRPATDGEGLAGGADEYIVKPFDWGVLRARVATGARIAKLQQSLSQRVVELQNALDTSSSSPA